MGPFNTFYLGRIVSQFQVSSLLAEVFLCITVPSTAINGFRKCGIVLLDSSVFSEVDFVAAGVKDTEVEGLVAHDTESGIVRDLVGTEKVDEAVDKDGGEDVNLSNNSHGNLSRWKCILLIP